MCYVVEVEDVAGVGAAVLDASLVVVEAASHVLLLGEAGWLQGYRLSMVCVREGWNLRRLNRRTARLIYVFIVYLYDIYGKCYL